MKHIFSQTLLGISLLLASPAFAGPPFEPKNFPNCVKLVGPSGDVQCFYTLERLKELYRADVTLTALKSQRPLFDRKIKSLNDVIKKQRIQFELTRSNSELLVKRNKELTAQLLEADRALQEEMAKPNWGSYFAWGIVIAVTAGFIGYVVADVSSNRKEGCSLTP